MILSINVGLASWFIELSLFVWQTALCKFLHFALLRTKWGWRTEWRHAQSAVCSFLAIKFCTLRISSLCPHWGAHVRPVTVGFFTWPGFLPWGWGCGQQETPASIQNPRFGGFSEVSGNFNSVALFYWRFVKGFEKNESQPKNDSCVWPS